MSSKWLGERYSANTIQFAFALSNWEANRVSGNRFKSVVCFLIGKLFDASMYIIPYDFAKTLPQQTKKASLCFILNGWVKSMSESLFSVRNALRILALILLCVMLFITIKNSVVMTLTHLRKKVTVPLRSYLRSIYIVTRRPPWKKKRNFVIKLGF